LRSDDPERATLPSVAASIAAVAGQEATGAAIVGAAKVVEEVVAGTRTIAFA
jgi:hypothetical protein